MTKQERTRRLIDSFRGLKDEFSMLKGVLCSDHWTSDLEDWKEGMRQQKIVRVYDYTMIAERMDELNREAYQRYHKPKSTVPPNANEPMDFV